MSADAAPAPRRSLPTNKQIFHKYYVENDVFSTPDGYLKLLAVTGCVSAAVVQLAGGGCAGAAAGSATSALAVAAATALLLAGRLLRAPLLAPQLWLYTDITVSATSGALLLVTGVLALTLCELAGPADYAHGALSLGTGALLVAGAAVSYSWATRLWDAAPAAPAPRAPPAELDA